MVLIPTHLTYPNVVLQELFEVKRFKKICFIIFLVFFSPLRKGSNTLPSINKANDQVVLTSKFKKLDWDECDNIDSNLSSETLFNLRQRCLS